MIVFTVQPAKIVRFEGLDGKYYHKLRDSTIMIFYIKFKSLFPFVNPCERRG